MTNYLKERGSLKMKKLYQTYGYILLLAYLVAAYFLPVLGVVAVICMMAPIFFSLIGKGRYWCGNFCPRGNFYENILSKISMKRKIPAFLKSWWFRGFMILFILSNFSRGIYKNWGNPAGIGMVFYRIILITTIVAIVLAVFYKPRTWCSFCPMGSMASLIAKMRGRKSAIHVAEHCVSCGLCNKACPMELTPKESKNGHVASSECIFCEKCVYTCPKDAIQTKSFDL